MFTNTFNLPGARITTQRMIFTNTFELPNHSSLLELLLKNVNTVEPPNRGHFGTAAFVLSSEVVLFSEVV